LVKKNERGNIEATYSYPLAERETMVSHMSANREAFASDYFAWVSKQAFHESLDEMLLRFEEETFGRALEESAHGMLLFAVRFKAQHFKTPPDAMFESLAQQDEVEAVAREAQNIDFVDSESHVKYIAIHSGLMSADEKAPPLVKAMPEVSDVQQPDWLPYKDADDEMDPIPAREPGADDDDDWYEDDDDAGA
jgi:hypothetical protein